MISKFIILIIIGLILILVLKHNYKKETFNINVCSNFSCVNDNCSITNESKFCKDDRKLINDTPNCNFEKVVDPKNPKCIDFCVKTYTRKDGTRDNQQRLVEKEFVEEKKHEYFASKCNECINNYYESIDHILS